VGKVVDVERGLPKHIIEIRAIRHYGPLGGELRRATDRRKSAFERCVDDVCSVPEEERGHENEKGFHGARRCRPERVAEVEGWTAQLDTLKLQTKARGQRSRLFPLIGRDSVPEHRHSPDSGQRFLDQLQPLAGQLDVAEENTRDVAAGLGEARNVTPGHRIVVHRCDHDRNGGGGVPGCLQRRLWSGRQYDVHVSRHKFARQLWKPADIALCVPELDSEVLSLDMSQLAHPLQHGLVERGTARIDRREHSELSGLHRLLRLGAAPCGEHGSQASHEGAAMHHSIT
jgi:hypothetical protein